MAYLVCGYGLIGKQRVASLLKADINPSDIVVVDPAKRDMELESKGIRFFENFENISLKGISHAIVAVPHQFAFNIVNELLNNKIEVLLEKPMGRNLQEVELLFEHANSNQLSIGFNYRFMRGIEKLKELILENVLGEIISVRIDLGHGGKPEDRKSWKLDPVVAGGGVVLDPGIHVIDLLNFFFPLGEYTYEFHNGVTWSGFWKTGIEEAAFVTGRIGNTILNLNLSIVAWRTRFAIEIIGSQGYALLNGRGRTDGPQTLKVGERWGWQNGKSQADSENLLVFSPIDESFFLETIAWLNGSPTVARAIDGLRSEKLRQEILAVIR